MPVAEGPEEEEELVLLLPPFDESLPPPPPPPPRFWPLSEMMVSRSFVSRATSLPLSSSDAEVTDVAEVPSKWVESLLAAASAAEAPVKSGDFKKDEKTSDEGDEGVARKYEAEGVDKRREVEAEVCAEDACECACEGCMCAVAAARVRLPATGELDMARRSSGFLVRIGGSDGDGRLNVGDAVGEWS